MIKLNYRYRGPFERDKFSISILSLSNEINENLDLLISKKEKLDELDKTIKFLGEEDNIANELYLELYRRGL